MKFSPSDWTLILAAFAYELEDAPIMEDATYDLLSAAHAARPEHCLIPDFDKSTGVWVHDLIPVIGEEALRKATARCRKMGKGTSSWHCVPHDLIEDVGNHGPALVTEGLRQKYGWLDALRQKGE